MLTADERAILEGIAADVDRIAALPWRGDGIAWGKPLGRYRVAINDAKAGLVRLEPSAWLGRALTRTQNQAFLRLLASMESRGLLERVAPSGIRATHVALTELGQAVAQRLKELAR